MPRMRKTQRKPTMIAREFEQWLSEATCEFDTAVTLTFRNDPESVEQASSDLRYFLNKLNDACFGNNWSRFAKHNRTARIAVVPIIENGFGTKRLHYHCVFSRPVHISYAKFRIVIALCWNDTRNGGDTRNDIKKIYDRSGFMGYITKELRIDDFDKLDATNTHIY